MEIKSIFRILSLLLMMFSLSMLVPLIINFIFAEQFWLPFVISFAATFCTGAILWLLFQHEQHELKLRDGFLLVVLFWILLCSFGSLPFLLTAEIPNFVDAVFEATSAFTTTGASIIPHLNDLPAAILFYRQLLQFLGGMGIIILAVAVLPMLGVGGMQLFKAETPGPMKESKLTPRIAETAKSLWLIYTLLTLCCAFCYWLAGMNWFNALGESFATTSTGGYAMHDTSFAYYKNDAIELIACVFMILGGANSALHFMAFRQKSLRPYWKDEEFRSYVFYLLIASALVTLSLVYYNFFKAGHHAFVASLFNVVSLATTTGFISEPFADWPTFVPWLILLLAVIGGCAGSTSGGLKVIRALILYKQSAREMTKLLHPNAILPIKFGGQVLTESTLQSLWSFISVYIFLFWTLVLIMLAFGNDITVSLSGVIGAISNSGAGLGSIAANFAALNDASKWLMIVAMVAGRLEIFAILILFTKGFWEK